MLNYMYYCNEIFLIGQTMIKSQNLRLKYDNIYHLKHFVMLSHSENVFQNFWWKFWKTLSSMTNISKIVYLILPFEIFTFCKAYSNKFLFCYAAIPTINTIKLLYFFLQGLVKQGGRTDLVNPVLEQVPFHEAIRKQDSALLKVKQYPRPWHST